MSDNSSTLPDDQETTYTKVRLTGTVTIEVEAEFMVPDGTDADSMKITSEIDRIVFAIYGLPAVDADMMDSPELDISAIEVLGTGLDEFGYEVGDDE